MPKIQPKPLKHRELLQRLSEYGIVVLPKQNKGGTKRGKGSEDILGRKSGIQPDGTYKGDHIPVKDHGDGTEHSKHVIRDILRRFDIDPKSFWKN